MGLVRDRWKKLSFRRSSFPPASPSPPTSSKPSDPPPEFLCPISGVLMADPVIISSGQTFERACIEVSSSPILIPNSALRSAILRWCDAAGFPHPIPPSSSSSSSSSSSEILIEEPTAISPASDPLEEHILLKLGQIQEQEGALMSLLEATRESPSRRVSLGGSPRLLAALRGLILSIHPAIRSAALAAVVNLSLERENKVGILRCGAVPAIVDSLSPASPAAAREHAAGALLSLAAEEQNRAAIGVLGAVPPLLHLFCSSGESLRARLEAGMALQYLGLAQMNATKLARVGGAVRELIAVAEGGEPKLSGAAMGLMLVLLKSKEGRAAMLDGGAVEAAVALLGKDPEMGIKMLHGMSAGGLRFRPMARAAGAEEALQRAAGDQSLEAEAREMATITVEVLRGRGDRDAARILWWEKAEEGIQERNAASETLLDRRRRNSAAGSPPNSAGF